MKNIQRIAVLVLLYVCMLLGGCASDHEKSVNLIRKGDYQGAEKILQEILMKNPADAAADSLFNCVVAVKLLQTASQLIDKEHFEEAVIRIKNAAENDSKSANLVETKTKLVNAVFKTADIYLSGGRFDEIIKLVELVIPLGVRVPSLQKILAEIYDARSENKVTWEVCVAWNRAADLNPGDQVCQDRIKSIRQQADPFINGFHAYYDAILNPNFEVWKSFLDGECIKETQEDVARAKEKYNETPFQTIKDYFILDLCIQPAEMGNTDGPSVVAVDVESPSSAWVYYTYPKMAVVEKIRVYKTSGRWKVSCKQETVMSKSSIYKDF